MGGPINIKGVTSGFSRHLGGGDLEPKKRFLDSKGYSQAFKKAFKTNDLNKIKQRFKEAGLKTTRFDTFQKIKEKDFLKDIKLAAKAGIIKDSEMAKKQFRTEQVKENRDLTFKEKRSFNLLSEKTKKQLTWGGKEDNLSFGAKIAAEQQKIRDQNIRKEGDVGIESFEIMEKEGEHTLWKRYKALKDLRFRNEVARKKLKEISSQINFIKLKAKRDPAILRNYGIPEMKKDKSAWKPKILPGREGARPQDDKEKDETKVKDKTSSSQQGNVIITHSAGGSAEAGISATDKKETPVVPFSIVKGFRNSEKEAKPLPAGTKDVVLSEKSTGDIDIQEELEEQEYGFIDQDGEDVKLG